MFILILGANDVVGLLQEEILSFTKRLDLPFLTLTLYSVILQSIHFQKRNIVLSATFGLIVTHALMHMEASIVTE